MTNNKLCNVIGAVGCLITFLSLVACFFGAGSWLLAAAGIALAAFSLWEYED